MTFQPVIKWSGSKRSQADEIIKYFPKKIDVYYEPFVGGGSILRKLLSTDIKVNNYICSDLNSDLIDLWNLIKSSPTLVADTYEKMWNELNIDDNKDRKREYFYMVRERFNKQKNPLDFMFIMRTTTNGMPRYNQNGEFNNSFHITRNGIKPETLRNIIIQWSSLLNEFKVEFICQDYKEAKANQNDFMYLDPPYANTRGMYYGALDYEELWEWLRNQKGKYILSFDGISGEIDNTYKVPKDIYNKHEYLLSGNSSFKRTIGKSNDSIVYESLYIK
ncbi:MAG: DNA adenine methylase [Tissierellia bacterium]|nr:DNA adenine methylase [Tissierellia bacterium]